MTEFEVQVLARLARIEKLLEREAGETNLLKIIHASVRGAEFTTAELVRHAALPANGELRKALGESDSRQLGRLLGSIAGRPLGGFIVEAIGKEHGAVIWRVQGWQLPLHIAPLEDDAHAEGSSDEGVKKCA